MYVELLSVPDCPHVDGMLELIRNATKGRSDVTVESRVLDVTRPMPAAFTGSPTVLIDGTNPSGRPNVSEPACMAALPSAEAVSAWFA